MNPEPNAEKDTPIRCVVCNVTSEGGTYLAFIHEHANCTESPALAQIKHLELLAQQVREQGDQEQVLLSLDGVSQTISLADELWLIAYLLRDALGLPTFLTTPVRGNDV